MQEWAEFAAQALGEPVQWREAEMEEIELCHLYVAENTRTKESGPNTLEQSLDAMDIER